MTIRLVTQQGPCFQRQASKGQKVTRECSGWGRKGPALPRLDHASIAFQLCLRIEWYMSKGHTGRSLPQAQVQDREPGMPKS